MRRTEVFLEPAVFLVGSLLLGIGFWTFGGTDPMWAIIAFILVYEPDSRMVISSAFARLLSTLFGSLAAMGAVYAFSIHKWTLPVSIFIVSLLGNLLQQSRPVRRMVLVTVALIVGSSLVQADSASFVAVVRSVEVCAGSILAIAFSGFVPRLSAGQAPGEGEDPG